MRNRTLGFFGIVALYGAAAYTIACGGSSSRSGGGEDASMPEGSTGEDAALTTPEASTVSDGSTGNDTGASGDSGDAAGGDAASDADSASPANDSGAEAAAACDPSKPFSFVAEVTSLDVVADAGAITARGARLSADFSTMYFGWNNILYTGAGAQTLTINATFTALAQIPVLTDTTDSETLAEGDPTVTPDGLTIYFGSNNQIWYATRSGSSSPWSTAQAASALASGNDTVNPYVQGDGSYLYFASARTKPSADAGTDAGADAGPFNLGNNDIYRIPLSADLPSGPIEHVVELSTPGDDLAPVVTADGKTIYFTRPAGVDGAAVAFRQIWSATRTTVPGPFGSLAVVAELEHDTASSDPTWVSPDNCTLYFSSFRDTSGAGGERMWVAVRGQ